jgi:hypothetical protein
MGWALGLLLVIGAAMAWIGPGTFQVAGFILVAVVLLFVVAGGSPGDVRGISTRGLDERRAEFGALPQGEPESLPEADGELWKRERERYEERAKDKPVA